ncbi:exported hypothetical protein [Candidatus Sulfopaludibacter sp. SbA4]|nr:exported hypothetical protein [Candidatus Sulfopaludibacter sp. SbA4]
MTHWSAFSALMVVAGLLIAPRSPAQSPRAAAATPKFDVTSVKPCGDGRRDRRTGDVVPGGGSPGRLRLGCWPLRDLVQSAYLSYADGQVQSPTSVARTPIEGGPAWTGTSSDRYTIDAEAEGTPGQAAMRGPMLQALLEDKFKLRIHRETREVPVYELTVATGGPKMQPFQEGGCTPIDRAAVELVSVWPVPPPAPGQKNCNALIGKTGPDTTLEAQAVSLAYFCQLLGLVLDRPAIDRTGITGRFDFHLVYARASAAPSIFTALPQQLGLKLEPAEGPREFLVIDHVERP